MRVSFCHGYFPTLISSWSACHCIDFVGRNSVMVTPGSLRVTYSVG